MSPGMSQMSSGTLFDVLQPYQGINLDVPNELQPHLESILEPLGCHPSSRPSRMGPGGPKCALGGLNEPWEA